MMNLASVLGLRQALGSKPRLCSSLSKSLRPWLYPTPRPLPRGGRRVPKKEPVLLDAGLVSFSAAWPTTICLWYCCEKHFHSLDRSAVIGLITALAAARLGLWSADHDLRLGYEPIITPWDRYTLVTPWDGYPSGRSDGEMLQNINQFHELYKVTKSSSAHLLRVPGSILGLDVRCCFFSFLPKVSLLVFVSFSLPVLSIFGSKFLSPPLYPTKSKAWLCTPSLYSERDSDFVNDLAALRMQADLFPAITACEVQQCRCDVMPASPTDVNLSRHSSFSVAFHVRQVTRQVHASFPACSIDSLNFPCSPLDVSWGSMESKIWWETTQSLWFGPFFRLCKNHPKPLKSRVCWYLCHNLRNKAPHRPV